MHAVAWHNWPVSIRNQICQLTFSLPNKSNLGFSKAFDGENYRLALSGKKHLATVFSASSKFRKYGVTTEPCNGKTVSHTKNFQRKGTPLDLPLIAGRFSSVEEYDR